MAYGIPGDETQIVASPFERAPASNPKEAGAFFLR